MTLTPDRLRELMSRLNERMVEAEGIRARLTSAREANLWPDLRSTSLLRSRRLPTFQTRAFSFAQITENRDRWRGGEATA
jgi:hypothetical protein